MMDKIIVEKVMNKVKHFAAGASYNSIYDRLMIQLTELNANISLGLIPYIKKNITGAIILTLILTNGETEEGHYNIVNKIDCIWAVSNTLIELTQYRDIEDLSIENFKEVLVLLESLCLYYEISVNELLISYL